MWKQILRNNSVLKSKTKCKNVRTFLSKSYSLNDEWNTRLNSSILEKVKVDTFYYDLEHKFQQQGKISAIDLDIYANKVEDGNHADELADLIHKFRMTEETTNALDSTGHAVVRNFLQFDQSEFLLQILNDRISYGVFLDNFTANLALNKFIESKDYSSAAKIATFLMLQEELDKPITKFLSLYACYKDLQNPTVIVEEVKEEVAPVEKSKKKKEEIKIRVGFLRNEFFDDHFDIRDNNHLMGKTLTMIGKKLDGPIGNGFTILGLCLHQKYAEAAKQIKKNQTVHKEIFDLINENLTKITSEDEAYNKCLTLVPNLPSQAGNLDEEISSLIKEAVSKFEKNEIDQQKEIYNSWIKERQDKLEAELLRLNRAQRLQVIEKKRIELEQEEQKLWFFENEDKMDLEIESKKVHYPKRWFGKKKKPRVIDEGYIPPEIKSGRN